MDFLREIVSGPKNRYKQNGYNLDLTYITDRIIAMAFPASGLEKLYRNSIDDVVGFLDEKHPNSYWIVNISGRGIDESKLKNTNSYDWEDHCAPSIETLFTICEKMYQYLSVNQYNIVAIHCNHGKGRTGTIICCFLLFCGRFTDPDKALTYYARKRFEVEGMGVTQPCQVRYVHYFHELLSSPKRSPSVVAISKVFLKGKCKLSAPYIKIKQLNTQKQLLSTKYMPVKEDQSKELVIIQPKTLVYFSGDVVIFLNNDNLVDKKIGRISLNTAFIPQNNTLTFKIHEIAPDSLKKSGMFDSGFTLTVHFQSICDCPNNIRFEQRCGICKPRVSCDESNWEAIYRIIDTSQQWKKGHRGSILFKGQQGDDIGKILSECPEKQ